MLRAGDIVYASFGRGMKTFKVQVAVLSVDWRHAMLLARDGEVYGPARITALQICHNVTDFEVHNWRTRIAAHHRDQNEEANIVVYDDAAAADVVAPELHVAEDRANPLEEMGPVEVAPAAEDVPLVLPEVNLPDQFDDEMAVDLPQQLCNICLTDAGTLQCEAGCVFCAGCLFDYGSQLLNSRPQDMLRCVCGDQIAWKTMATAWPQEHSVGLDRLVAHFAHSQVEAAQQPKELGINAMFDQLQTNIPNIMAATQDLKTPCCGIVFVDFQDCFAVTCHGCGKYFCAWCIDADCVFTSSQAAHNHVRICDDNPQPGAVYGDPMRWDSHCVGVKRERLNTARLSLYHKVTKLCQSVTDAHFYWETGRYA